MTQHSGVKCCSGDVWMLWQSVLKFLGWIHCLFLICPVVYRWSFVLKEKKTKQNKPLSSCGKLMLLVFRKYYAYVLYVSALFFRCSCVMLLSFQSRNLFIFGLRPHSPCALLCYGPIQQLFNLALSLSVLDSDRRLTISPCLVPWWQLGVKFSFPKSLLSQTIVKLMFLMEEIRTVGMSKLTEWELEIMACKDLILFTPV